MDMIVNVMILSKVAKCLHLLINLILELRDYF